MNRKERIFETDADVIVQILDRAWHLTRGVPPDGRHPTVLAMLIALTACDAALFMDDEGEGEDEKFEPADRAAIQRIRNQLAVFIGMPVEGVPAAFRRAFEVEDAGGDEPA